MYTSINHNLMAADTARYLNLHYANLATSTQRLSSGLRINSAADDAAGLAIRELMRADVAALNQGIRNANDAISMLQVADGALGIIDEKLIRMKELAEQAATGTYNSTQRLMIDSEFQAMASEIDRIANATDFNGIKLLSGTTMPQIVLNTPVVETIDKIDYSTTYELNEFGVYDQTTATITTSTTQTTEYIEKDGNIFKKTDSFEVIDKSSQRYSVGVRGTVVRKFIPPFADMTFDLRFLNDSGTELFKNYEINNSLTNKTFMDSSHIGDPFSLSYVGPVDPLDPVLAYRPYKHIYMLAYDINKDSISEIGLFIYLKSEVNLDTLKDNVQLTDMFIRRSPAFQPTTIHEEKNSVQLEKIDINQTDCVKIHFGPGNDSAEDYYYIENRYCTTNGLGIGELSIKTQDRAQEALISIDDAIIKKDEVRAYYGTMQNRLENTVTNLTTQAENLQASESRISDVNVATEMTNFVRNQILTQSAVAMLGQANSMPQMLTQLISG